MANYRWNGQHGSPTSSLSIAANYTNIDIQTWPAPALVAPSHDDTCIIGGGPSVSNPNTGTCNAGTVDMQISPTNNAATFTGVVTLNNGLTLSKGTFTGTINTAGGNTIGSGSVATTPIFTGAVVNISTNDSYIYRGTFTSCIITNAGIIQGGTYTTCTYIPNGGMVAYKGTADGNIGNPANLITKVPVLSDTVVFNSALVITPPTYGILRSFAFFQSVYTQGDGPTFNNEVTTDGSNTFAGGTYNADVILSGDLIIGGTFTYNVSAAAATITGGTFTPTSVVTMSSGGIVAGGLFEGQLILEETLGSAVITGRVYSADHILLNPKKQPLFLQDYMGPINALLEVR